MDKLLIDDEKRVKRGKFMFKLTRTVATQFYKNDTAVTTPLLKLADNDHRHFVLEQNRKRSRDSSRDEIQRARCDGQIYDGAIDNEQSDDGLPPEITQMVNEHLSLKGPDLDAPITTKRKRSKKHFTGGAAQVVSMPSLDYVYDIYHLEKVTDDELTVYREGNVGFVKIVNRWVDLVPDEDSDPARGPSDDEDSNEEDYYQNDYPEDEDDDRSILFGSEGEDVAADETTNHIQDLLDSELMLSTEGNEIRSREQGEYAELFSQLGNSGNILNSLNAMNFVDLDDNEGDEKALEYDGFDSEDDDEGNYERNVFFQADEHDPLAVHRDRIFGKLQRMVDK